MSCQSYSVSHLLRILQLVMFWCNDERKFYMLLYMSFVGFFLVEGVREAKHRGLYSSNIVPSFVNLYLCNFKNSRLRSEVAFWARSFMEETCVTFPVPSLVYLLVFTSYL